MKRKSAILMPGLLASALYMSVIAATSTAGPMPVLSKEEQRNWTAVGRVNAVGFRVRQSCSGTLIAPDLVVTAAHCVHNISGVGKQRHFVAGWHRSKFVAHSVSSDIVVHPLYPQAVGDQRYVYDIALVRLPDPIPQSLVPAIPLMPANFELPQEALLLGYQNKSSASLSGQSGCPRTMQQYDDVSVYGCEVMKGASGGPAIVQRPDGPALIGVIAARVGAEGHALIVPLDDWLRTAWKEALARDAARPD